MKARSINSALYASQVVVVAHSSGSDELWAVWINQQSVGMKGIINISLKRDATHGIIFEKCGR